MVAHAVNPSMREADLYECETNLVYRSSSCKAKATQRNLS